MNLTPEQQQAIKAGEAVEVTIDGNRCAVLAWDAYQELLVDEGLPTPLARARMLRAAMAEDDADDPALQHYQKYKRNP